MLSCCTQCCAAKCITNVVEREKEPGEGERKSSIYFYRDSNDFSLPVPYQLSSCLFYCMFTSFTHDTIEVQLDVVLRFYRLVMHTGNITCIRSSGSTEFATWKRRGYCSRKYIYNKIL